MRFYTKNGASNSSPASRSTSCLHTVRNSIRSKEFGSSHVASVYTMFSSRISKRLPIALKNNLSSGKIRMIPSENFVHWYNIYAITYVVAFSFQQPLVRISNIVDLHLIRHQAKRR